MQVAELMRLVDDPAYLKAKLDLDKVSAACWAPRLVE